MKPKGPDVEVSVFGIFLLIISLFSDGMLANQQQNVQKKHGKSFGVYHLMSGTNLFTFIFSLAYGIATNQVLSCINFCLECPSAWKDLALITALGCVGQFFIFYTISKFGSVLLSIFTTTRKFLTVLASIFYFKHEVNSYQWASILLVFTGVVIELVINIHNKGKKTKST